MPTRQYVGARYVPKFANPITWSNDRAYEALEIVTHLGTSYTSKKPVPVGVAITNAEYWVATGNYNAQVEEYRQAVEFYSNLARRNYRNIILIGDSYGTTNGSTTIINNTLPSLVKSYLGLDNNTFRSAFQNGAGFGNGKFYDNFSALAAGMTTEEKAAVTDIYFIGGWNDSSAHVTQAEFVNGVEDCEELITSDFPNAVKHADFVARSSRVSTYQNLSTTMVWYDNLELRGWDCDKNMRYVLVNPNWMQSAQTESSHPNQIGVNMLALYLTESILTGKADVCYQSTFIAGNEITWEDDVNSNFNSVSGFVEFGVNNNTCNIRFYVLNSNWQIKFIADGGVSAPKTIQFGGGAVKIGTLTDKIPGYYENVIIPASIDAYDSEGNCYNVDGSISIKNNELYLRPGARFNSALNAWDSMSVHSFLIKNSSGTVPTIYL